MQPREMTWHPPLLQWTPFILLATCALGAAADLQPSSSQPQPLPKDLVAAWKKAGAAVGWVHVNEFGSPGYEFVDENKATAGDVPAFWGGFKCEGVLSKLPQPETPFALDLGYPGVTDA